MPIAVKADPHWCRVKQKSGFISAVREGAYPP